jgi:TIR domain
MARPRQKRQRFAVGAIVRLVRPGVNGVVVLVEDEPAALGEYWHTIQTEHGPRREPGCDLELRPAAITNSGIGFGPAVRASDDPGGMVLSGKTAPRVFISYSRDSEPHKDWVRSLATRLREAGVDAVIDQTHLLLGARNPEFMERCIRESACVLVVCTDIYKRRFDKRQGGAGYEGHIITGEIVNGIGENKFIPALRAGEWTTALPSALLGASGVDAL